MNTPIPTPKTSTNWNGRYRQAVTAACQELQDMAANTMTWDAHAAVVITKHLTPLFRDLRDEAKRKQP